MPLEAIGPMMKRAVSGRYGVGYFESWNLESLQGVVDAAEQTASPIILGFNGAFLSREQAAAEERLDIYAALGRAAAESSSVPCGLIFNECPRDDWVKKAIGAGFNLVMLADAAAPHAEYVARVTEITRLAHARGIAVEGELGELPYGPAAHRGLPQGGNFTDPAAAAEFVAATGVDLLAVSVGNVHIQTRGQSGLDLGLLEKIQRSVPVPLVLHGGTGIADESLKAAIALGVAKVNFGTYLKQRYLKAVRTALGNDMLRPASHAGNGRPGRCPGGGPPGRPRRRARTDRAAGMLRQGFGSRGRLMEIAMRMPDLGTVDDTIKVVKWLAEVGQPILRGQPLVEVETDKSIMELESTVTGTLEAITVSAGGEAAAGQIIATFAVDGERQSEAVARGEGRVTEEA